MAGPLLQPIDTSDPWDNLDEELCCCDDPAEPKRKTTGQSFGGNGGVVQVQLMGQRGVDSNGQPVWVGVEVTPDGALKIDTSEMPAGQNGTYVNSNMTEVLLNGRIITRTLSGSGLWSKIA